MYYYNIVRVAKTNNEIRTKPNKQVNNKNPPNDCVRRR